LGNFERRPVGVLDRVMSILSQLFFRVWSQQGRTERTRMFGLHSYRQTSRSPEQLPGSQEVMHVSVKPKSFRSAGILLLVCRLKRSRNSWERKHFK